MLSTLMSDDNYPDKNVHAKLSTDFEVINTVQNTEVNNSYVFEIPYVHRQARGFLGFTSMKTTDAIRSLTAEALSKLNSTYHILYPYRNTVKTSSGTLINETTSVYTITGAGVHRYYNPLNYTDPDGEYALIDDLIAAAIGGTVNGVQFKLSHHDLDRVKLLHQSSITTLGIP